MSYDGMAGAISGRKDSLLLGKVFLKDFVDNEELFEDFQTMSCAIACA